MRQANAPTTAPNYPHRKVAHAFSSFQGLPKHDSAELFGGLRGKHLIWAKHPVRAKVRSPSKVLDEVQVELLHQTLSPLPHSLSRWHPLRCDDRVEAGRTMSTRNAGRAGPPFPNKYAERAPPSRPAAVPPASRGPACRPSSAPSSERRTAGPRPGALLTLTPPERGLSLAIVQAERSGRGGEDLQVLTSGEGGRFSHQITGSMQLSQRLAMLQTLNR